MLAMFGQGSTLRFNTYTLSYTCYISAKKHNMIECDMFVLKFVK